MLAPEQPGRQSMASQDQRIGGQLFESDNLKTKNLIFAIVFTIIQFFFCFIYGFLYYTPAEMFNVTSVVTAIFMAILIVAGKLYPKCRIWTCFRLYQKISMERNWIQFLHSGLLPLILPSDQCFLDKNSNK